MALQSLRKLPHLHSEGDPSVPSALPLLPDTQAVPHAVLPTKTCRGHEPRSSPQLGCGEKSIGCMGQGSDLRVVATVAGSGALMPSLTHYPGLKWGSPCQAFPGGLGIEGEKEAVPPFWASISQRGQGHGKSRGVGVPAQGSRVQF